MHKPKVAWTRWAGAGIVILLAFQIGRSVSSSSELAAAQERAVFRAAVLTSPYLETLGAENGAPALVRARPLVAEYIAEARSKDPTLDVSVYARDLERGGWIGIDDHERYLPSSLTKVAILIYTLHRGELDPQSLDETLVFPGAEAMLGDDSMGSAADSVRMQAGVAYSRRDLLRRMIAYSDNHASQMLMEGDTGEGIARMLYTLSAEQSFVDGEYLFDAHTVGALLRVLYQSSFLSRPRSEFALDLLTQNFYADGLRRHLPKDLMVASKFGFHASLRNGRPHHELHECGIIYRPGAPYVLCVMTRTDKGSPESLDEVIGEVSRIIWANQMD